uniref:Ig-like domain-containing protein n=1 Tax=Labrus bergylta TaxID=56723 RepID=A0A3Q3GL23_9LABR
MWFLKTETFIHVCFWSAVPPGVDHVEPVEPVTVVQGSLVTLTCEARGVPPPTLTWLKDGQPLSLHRNLLLDGQETRLQLPDVAPLDAGLYSCVASNQAGSSTKSFNLTVLEPPKISSSTSPEELTIAVNSPLELECFAVGVPQPTLSWLKDGRPLVGTGIVQQDGQFVRISKVQVTPPRLTLSVSSPSVLSAGWSYPTVGRGSVPGDTGSQARGQWPLQLCGDQPGRKHQPVLHCGDFM